MRKRNCWSVTQIASALTAGKGLSPILWVSDPEKHSPGVPAFALSTRRGGTLPTPTPHVLCVAVMHIIENEKAHDGQWTGVVKRNLCKMIIWERPICFKSARSKLEGVEKALTDQRVSQKKTQAFFLFILFNVRADESLYLLCLPSYLEIGQDLRALLLVDVLVDLDDESAEATVHVHVDTVTLAAEDDEQLQQGEQRKHVVGQPPHDDDGLLWTKMRRSESTLLDHFSSPRSRLTSSIVQASCIKSSWLVLTFLGRLTHERPGFFFVLCPSSSSAASKPWILPWKRGQKREVF